MMKNLRYRSYGVSLDDLNSELDQLWIELRTKGSFLNKQAISFSKKNGLQGEADLEKLQKLSRTEVISLRQEGSGLDPASTAVIVAFAPVAAKITADLWSLLLQRIRSKKGSDSLSDDEEE